MCGIFSYKGKNESLESLKDSIDLIKYRGPDNSKYKIFEDNVLFGFHRLSIVGISESGNQPLFHPEDNNLSLICNGEIYNFKKLANKYNFNLQSGSDCEIILHLYKKLGIEKTVKELDGVFMFVLYDETKNVLFSARDPFGVRPGFIGYKNNDIYIASEVKPIAKYCDKILPFKPGTWFSSDNINQFNSFYKLSFENILNENEIFENIKKILTESVKKRLMSERKIGCLLSGGLDSSLIAALVAKYGDNSNLDTFSIGMPGSVDLYYADIVAKHIGSNHHHVEISSKEFLSAIEEVIYKIESYDITTVRASIGNYLVSKYIKNNTDCKVIFNGDGSDEVCCGYFYLKNAPDMLSLQNESKRLIEEIHLFDVLRSDRSISSNGLEPRTPFLDKQFVQYYFSIAPELKKFDGVNKIEKYLLRQSFKEDNLLPKEILWRNKCAFSDGVSNQKNSWHTIIKSYFEEKISDDEFNKCLEKYKHCPPNSKESYYYRKVFDKYFSCHEKLIPHYWMPNWSNVIDPSARELGEYKEN